jgi:hypothetical protein
MKNLIFLLLFLYSCHKTEISPYEKFIIECENSMNFISTNVKSENFCSGKISGKPFLWSDSLSTFKSYSQKSIWASNNSIDKVQYVIGLLDTNNFQQYPHPESFSIFLGLIGNTSDNLISAIDDNIKIGKLNLAEISNKDGKFSILMPVSCGALSPLGGSDSTWKSETGDQKNSYLECTKIEKIDNNNIVHYSISIKFSVNIYKDVFGEKLWNRFTDCTMNLNFSVNK